MTLTARPLRPDEWQDLRAIRLRALADAPGNFFASMAEEEARPETHWRDLLDGEGKAVFGIFDGDALVGITAAFRHRDDPTGETGGLGMTWLDPSVRGRGGGRVIYDCRLAWARAQAFRRVKVGHRDGNEPSRRAMLAAGFRPVGRRPWTWPDGAEADDIMYELVL